MSRRAGALLAGAVFFGIASLGSVATAADNGHAADAAATKTPIKHFVTLMQENHSFDNYFGTYPGADGIPAGTCMPRRPGVTPAGCVKPHHIGNAAIQDLGHNLKIFNREFRHGKMDGFISAFRDTGLIDQTEAMGYYDDRNLPYYWNIADNYVLFDRNFSSAHRGSIQNHMYWVTGGPGARGNIERIPPNGFNDPTIFDRLEAAGVSWKFYVQNYDPAITFRSDTKGDRAAQIVWVPLLDYPRYLDNPELFKHIVPIEEYYQDLAKGTLPSVSYIVPSGASEHPPGSIAAGQSYVRTLITSLMRSSSWKDSAFVWSYDDWGGWYDHVFPPSVDKFGYGPRVPMLLVSPYAKRGYIDHNTADFTSQLAFIEHNWGVKPLTARDAKAYPLTDAFDFDAGPRAAQFLTLERHPAPPVKPRRTVVYVAYGAALLFFLVVAAAAALVHSRRHTAPQPAKQPQRHPRRRQPRQTRPVPRAWSW